MNTRLIAATTEHPHRVQVSPMAKESATRLLSHIGSMLDRVGANRGADWALSIETDGERVRLSFSTQTEPFAKLLGKAIYEFNRPKLVSVQPTIALENDPRVQRLLFGNTEDSFHW